MSDLMKPMMGTDPKDWKWQQVAECGHFKGHGAGEFSLTPKVFDEIVRNFKHDSLPIPWDFEHASEQDPTSGSIPTSGTPAQGWVHDLDNRGIGGLWALVEWGKLAKGYVESGQYRYCSPAVRFGCKDRVTGAPVGARLTSVALTGLPFLKGLRPLAAKDEDGYSLVGTTSDGLPVYSLGGFAMGAPMKAPHEYMPALRAAFGAHPLATYSDLSDHLGRLREACAMADEDGTHEGRSVHDYVGPLAAATGLSPTASVADVLDCVEEMIEAAMARHVAEDHPGAEFSDEGASAEMADRAPATAQETNDMDPNAVALKDSQEKATALSAQLKDSQDKVLAVAAEKATLLSENAALVAKVASVAVLLALKDGEKLEDGVARIVEANRALLADKEKRDQADLEADVDVAIATYKDVKQLSDKDRPNLLVVAKASREAFNALYPPIPPEQRHLLLKVVQPAPRAAPTSADIAGETPSLNALTKRLMSEKGLSYSDAVDEACRLLKTPATPR